MDILGSSRESKLQVLEEPISKLERMKMIFDGFTTSQFFSPQNLDTNFSFILDFILTKIGGGPKFGNCHVLQNQDCFYNV